MQMGKISVLHVSKKEEVSILDVKNTSKDMKSSDASYDDFRKMRNKMHPSHKLRNMTAEVEAKETSNDDSKKNEHI